LVVSLEVYRNTLLAYPQNGRAIPNCHHNNEDPDESMTNPREEAADARMPRIGRLNKTSWDISTITRPLCFVSLPNSKSFSTNSPA
jgi:hypothetical protein